MSETSPIVYIVDDDEATRAYFSAALSSANLTCRTVESAQMFLDAYDPQQPGCVLLDVQMPGMTGLELQQQLNMRGAISRVHSASCRSRFRATRCWLTCARHSSTIPPIGPSCRSVSG